MLYIPCVEFQFHLISKGGRDSGKEGDNAPPALPLNEALHLNHTSFKDEYSISRGSTCLASAFPGPVSLT